MTKALDNGASEFDGLIGRYLRAQAFAKPDHERIGPFVASFDPHSDNPFLSYAVPDDLAEPQEAEVAALTAAFARRRRKPRLEYVTRSAPAVEQALLRMGFEIEQRYPVMACLPHAAVVREEEDIAIALAQSEGDILAAAKTASAAYGDEGISAASLKAMVARGALLAVTRAQGAVVGVGMATAMQEGVVEIAGIGVIDAFRKRGIAGALTGYLSREAFARGAKLAWLTPGHAAAERIYARAGFSRASEQLHISKTL